MIHQVDARGTIFQRTYSPANHLISETATSADGTQSQTTTYAYDEAGDLKTANNGVQTNYNLVNGSYQPDPYGLTTAKADTVAGTTIPMSFGYDSRQRLTSMTYPDASTVTYGYNQLDQVTSMPLWISGSLGYDGYGRMTGFTLANGATKSISYDSQDRLAGLSYAVGSSALTSYTFTYDQASNIIAKNNNTYTYDALNQLIGASENGWFQKKPSDLAPSYTTVDRDYLGTTVLSFNAQATTAPIALDMASRSVGVDLGAVYGVNKIELHPQATSTRVRAQNITVYISSDNATTGGSTVSDYVPVTGWTLTTNSNGSLTLNFPTIFQARYIKINTIWDDRDINDVSIDKATFVNTASELVKVWALVTSQNQTYSYDAIGNRSSVTTNGVAENYTYYPNLQGGNLSWVRYDGTWYYEYDQAGNTIVKAKELLPGTFGSEPVDTTQEYWNYSWDLHNRLVNVTKSGQQLVAYVYDAENFRVQRVGKNGTTVYAYDRSAALSYQNNLTTDSAGASCT